MRSAGRVRQRLRAIDHADLRQLQPHERRNGLELVIARAKLNGLHCLDGYGEHRHDFALLLDRGRKATST
jgi:hypothetical protein